MAEYRRFVAYIYEYTNGKKNKNTGFAKIESRSGICRIQVHLQEISREEDSLNIYGFVREGDWLLGLFLGNVSTQMNNADARIVTPTGNIGDSDYTLEQLAGLWVDSSMGRTYITLFDEGPLDTERLVLEIPTNTIEKVQEILPEVAQIEVAEAMSESEMEPPEGKAVSKSEMELPEGKPVSEPEVKLAAAKPEPPEESEEALLSAAENEEEAVQTQGTGVCPQMGCPKQLPCQAGTEQRWQCFSKHYPHIQPFADNEIEDCIQITPKDLRLLRESGIGVGNNSFLMHGYYNYRHLLLAKRSVGGYLLGVPGLYESQEQVVANMFGFTNFKETARQNSPGRFGYWCRLVE